VSSRSVPARRARTRLRSADSRGRHSMPGVCIASLPRKSRRFYYPPPGRGWWIERSPAWLPCQAVLRWRWATGAFENEDPDLEVGIIAEELRQANVGSPRREALDVRRNR
jgi:hypothetical protein